MMFQRCSQKHFKEGLVSRTRKFGLIPTAPIASFLKLVLWTSPRGDFHPSLLLQFFLSFHVFCIVLYWHRDHVLVRALLQRLHLLRLSLGAAELDSLASNSARVSFDVYEKELRTMAGGQTYTKRE